MKNGILYFIWNEKKRGEEFKERKKKQLRFSLHFMPFFFLKKKNKVVNSC
jgi:hypothetical protein